MKTNFNYNHHTRGRKPGEELTDAQIKEWWDRVKDAPYNPRRDYDFQQAIGFKVYFRNGQFNVPFKNDKRKRG